jgi:hypothetical protein
MLTQVEITKTDDDHYHVFADKPVHIEEDVDWPKLLGMFQFKLIGTTCEEVLALFDTKPVGHKMTVTYDW